MLFGRLLIIITYIDSCMRVAFAKLVRIEIDKVPWNSHGNSHVLQRRYVYPLSASRFVIASRINLSILQFYRVSLSEGTSPDIASIKCWCLYTRLTLDCPLCLYVCFLRRWNAAHTTTWDIVLAAWTLFSELLAVEREQRVQYSQ